MFGVLRKHRSEACGRRLCLVFKDELYGNIDETRHSRLPQASGRCFRKTSNIPPSCTSDLFLNSLESSESITLKLAEDNYAWFPFVYSK